MYVCLFVTEENLNVTILFDKGKWLRNDEIDGGEWVAMEPPPQVVQDYLNSLVKTKEAK